jgi:hypothetical protein
LLDENILVVDIDPDHWTRLLKLFESGREKPAILFLMVENGVCLKAIHSKHGAIRPFDYGNGDLAVFCEREQVDYVARVGRDFFPSLFKAAQAEVEYDEDYISQLMTLFNGATAYTAENIDWYPERPHDLKPLQYDKAQKILNKAFPDRRIFLFCIVEQGMPYTSLILGKRSGDITLMTTLDALDRAHKPFDPREDLPELVEEIEEKFEPVHLAFIIEKDCFTEMLRGERPLTFLHAAIRHGRAHLTPLSWKMKLVLWYARKFRGM